ncbi:MAG: type IV toxin-antitoxin system AbiEi family antitoxin domain-containing protein [Sphaerochaeta sp.]|nr:type IV toxin-antitoxin system AbiEi family antitoxin domain-containing protein [Sphaerochaeta sp.]
MAALDSVLREGLLVDRTWLGKHGIGATAVDYYLRSGKMETLVHGLYRKPGPPLKWQNAVYSLMLLGYNVHVGHMTALTYHGYDHYLRLGGAQRIRLYSIQKLPLWVEKVEIGPGFVMMKRNPFAGDALGMVEVPFGAWDWPIRYSTPERAFIELASTIETSEEILQVKMMLEGAANLRPRQLQALLEACENIKAKRLFLWLARMAGHSWYQHIDTSGINLGTGKRQIVPNGTLDSQFMITVPKEVQDGKEESLF